MAKIDDFIMERVKDIRLDIEESERYRNASETLKEISNESKIAGDDISSISLEIAYREGFFDAVEFIRAFA